MKEQIKKRVNRNKDEKVRCAIYISPTLIALLFIALLILPGCLNENDQPVRTYATAKDFEEADQVSPQLADGFEMSLWAPGPLLSNAVALTFDNQGVAYVSETSRRISSDLDIRAHRDWMVDDLSLQSLDDTRSFHLEKLATQLSDQNIWQEDFNNDGLHDYHDLEVQSEYIRKIWDSDGDGSADVSHLFAKGFNSMLTGVAAGILYHNDDIYLTAAPDVWRLSDDDRDGLADERANIAHGFGIHIAYAGHGMSGLTIGPDGRIYWSIGDIGVNAVGPNGKRWKYPNQGAVMRCNPDGTDFEVFAHGLRNTQELAFDNYGNLISVDNDSDYPGEHERYVHIVEGSDSGWRINWQFGKYDKLNESYRVWQAEKLHLPHFQGQAAYILPPLRMAYDGPCGFTFNPGTALSKEWKDYFFASYFTGSSARSKIQAFKIKAKGASFEITGIKDIVGGIVPTGITFAPDGALYINDWKDSYDKKHEGRIWKLDVTDEHKNKLRKETQRMLGEGMKERSVEDLSQLLGHADQRVRMAAQFELVNRKKLDILVDVAKNNSNLFARLHAVWGIGQLARLKKEIADDLVPLLGDKNGNIRAQTAKIIGDAKYHPTSDILINLLRDEHAYVQFYAAEALGKLANSKAFQPLVNLLERVEEADPHLRHAAVYALSRSAKENELVSLTSHSSKHVRIGAVVALRHMRSTQVASFLSDIEPLVVVEAARAIHDDFSIPEGLRALAEALKRKDIHDEAFIRRAINANLRLGDRESAQRLAEYVHSQTVTETMRLDALWALGYWSEPPLLDRVEGRYRELTGHRVEDARDALASIFQQLIKEKSSMRAAIITAAGRIKFQEAASEIFRIFKDQDQEVEVTQAALQALHRMKSAEVSEAVDLALSDDRIALREDAQELLTELHLPENQLISLITKILDNNTIPEKQKALASLSATTTSLGEQVLGKWLDKLIKDQVHPALQLDVLTAVHNSAFDELKRRKTVYENSKDSTNILAAYDVALFGGDKQKGQNIFARNESAQCLRCHVVNGNGGEVGPDLTDIALKLTRAELMRSLVDPSFRIAPGYGTVILDLKNGEKLSGLLQSESGETLTVKSGNNPNLEIAKSNIEKIEHLPSGMPSASSVLNREQIRDLIAFLVTLE